MASWGRTLRHGVEALAFRILVRGVRGVSRRRALALGTWIGGFAFDRGIRRRVAVENVTARIGPDTTQEAIRIARESYRTTGRTFMDLLRADLLSDRELWSIVDRDKMRPIEAVASEGCGGVLVSGHFGNWELLVLAARRLGIPLAILAGDQSNAAVDRAVRKLRARAGITSLSVRSGLRDAVQIMRDGGFIATLMDQDARRKGVFADFLGTPASSHTGVLSLAMRAGAPVLFGVLPDSNGTLVPHFSEVWRPDPARSQEENLRHGVESYNRFLEGHVRAAPENYFWVHRRWKTRPPGESA